MKCCRQCRQSLTNQFVILAGKFFFVAASTVSAPSYPPSRRPSLFSACGSPLPRARGALRTWTSAPKSREGLEMNIRNTSQNLLQFCAYLKSSQVGCKKKGFVVSCNMMLTILYIDDLFLYLGPLRFRSVQIFLLRIPQPMDPSWWPPGTP